MRKSIQAPRPSRPAIRVIDDRPIPFELTDRALAALETGDLRGTGRSGRWTVRLRDLESWRRGEAVALALVTRSTWTTR